MSIRSLCINRNFGKNILNYGSLIFISRYSRRSNNDEEPFKRVAPKKPIRDVANNTYRDPNYDLLVPSKGFPFFMPGNIGPAWYDVYSTAQSRVDGIMEEITRAPHKNMNCQVQGCPKVLRQSVCELFPNSAVEQMELSVVTLTMRPDLKLLRFHKELETEKMAQSFVLAAHGICKKLRSAGYWADFINPFSGRPYIHPPVGDSVLYANDEKFRCMDFQIISIQDCKIVMNEEDKYSSKRFTGSLFTNAPSKKSQLDSIFTDDD